MTFSAEELAQVRENAEAGGGWSLKAWVAEAALRPPDGVAGNNGRAQVLVEFMRTQRQLRGVATNLNQIAAAVNRVLAGGAADRLPDDGQVAEVFAAVAELPAVVAAVEAAVVQVRDAVIEVQRERRSR